MNWYRRFAILLLVLGIASVAAIWVFDPNDADYKQIDLTLKVAAAIGTISGIYLAIVGAARDQKLQDWGLPRHDRAPRRCSRRANHNPISKRRS